jgi:hypothetical protein
MSFLPGTLCQSDEQIQTYLNKLQEAQTLVMMIMAVWGLIRRVAVRLLEEELSYRAHQPQCWPYCAKCGHILRSKGFKKRQLLTLFGTIRWQRRVGSCPQGCRGSRRAPLDERLGLRACQRTSDELKRLGCALVVFVPFETAMLLLRQLTGITLSADTLWRWTQEVGGQMMAQVNEELQQLEQGALPEQEAVEAGLEQSPLLIGADGVMVPFRPQPNTPKGKTQWREIKVGILARLKHGLTKTGHKTSCLAQRRLVAVLGSIDQFKPYLKLEALRQGVAQCRQVVWLSDGGRGFWRLFRQLLKPLGVIGILDFYHGAQNISKAAKHWLDGRTRQCRRWFERLRHQLRHGAEQEVIRELSRLVDSKQLPEAAQKTMENLQLYLTTHQEHIQYEQFKQMGFPIGSGLVESACKWLVQQRFKGVGMRWSEAGFNCLLHMRLAWVNQRFDSFFPVMALPSPN